MDLCIITWCVLVWWRGVSFPISLIAQASNLLSEAQIKACIWRKRHKLTVENIARKRMKVPGTKEPPVLTYSRNATLLACVGGQGVCCSDMTQGKEAIDFPKVCWWMKWERVLIDQMDGPMTGSLLGRVGTLCTFPLINNQNLWSMNILDWITGFVSNKIMSYTRCQIIVHTVYSQKKVVCVVFVLSSQSLISVPFLLLLRPAVFCQRPSFLPNYRRLWIHSSNSMRPLLK